MVNKTDVEKARTAADLVRKHAPGLATQIEQAIDDYISGKRDGLKVDVSINYRLEKFDGEFSPDKQPVEVITGVG